MNIFKTAINIIYAVVIFVLIVVAVGTAFSIFQAPGGVRLFVVQSGSMEPAIHTGSLVVVAPQGDYKEGEIITFWANPNERDFKKAGTTVTHRIVKVANDEGRATYETKGDANEDVDREMVAADIVLGQTILNLPYLGYIVAFSKTQVGLIALIIIPATIIIYSELVNIKKEIAKMVEQKQVDMAEKAKQKPVKLKAQAKTKKTGKKFKVKTKDKKKKK